jgi:hypothetical protein
VYTYLPKLEHRASEGETKSHLKRQEALTDETELSTEGLEDPDTAEELEILEDPEADEEPENLKDLDDGKDSDFKMLEDEEDDGSDSAMVVNKASMARRTSSVSHWSILMGQTDTRIDVG